MTEAARALRAIFLNIVGDTKTEIDEGVTWTTGEIEGLRDVIKLYAKDAWEAAQASEGIIDPMKAIQGLHESVEAGVLSEAKLMEMVSDIGGKLRTSQLLAIVNNWDMYESMLETYRNAYGSADKEIENAMDSWTRKTEVLKNKWTEFVKTSLSSTAFKGFLDIITAFVARLDTLHSVLTRIALIVVGLNFTKIIENLKKAKDAAVGFAQGLKGIGDSAAALNWISAILVVIGTALSAISYAQEDAKIKWEAATEKIYEEATAAKTSAEEIFDLYKTMETADKTTGDFQSSVESLADALGKDIPNSAEDAIAALRKYTAEQLYATAADTNTAKVRAQEAFLRTSKESKTVEISEYGNAAYEIFDDALVNRLNSIIEKLPFKYGSEGFFGIESYDDALSFYKTMEQVADEIEKYALSVDKSVLDSAYYKSVRDYLASVGDSFTTLTEKTNDATEAYAKYIYVAEGLSDVTIKTADDERGLAKTLREKYHATQDDIDAVLALIQVQKAQEDGVSGATASVKEETNALFANQKALEANATASEKAAAAKKDAEAAVADFCDALFDETGELTTAGKAALAASQYLADLTEAELNARLEMAKANYANLRAQLAAVATDALKAAYALIALEDAAAENGIIENEAARLRRKAGGADALLRELKALEATINSTEVQATAVKPYTSGYSASTGSSGSHSSGGSHSSSTSTEDKKLTSLKERVTLLKSELSLMQARGDSEEDQIAKMREIQAALEAERAYLASIKGDQATINGLAEEWWNYQNKITDLQEQAAEAAKKQADAVQAALEATIALNNAEKQRSVRVYNKATGQWEWAADPSSVASAREAYNNAMANLSNADLASYNAAVADWKHSLHRQALAQSGILPSNPFTGAMTSNFNTWANSVNGGATYNFGGVTISEAQAKNMTVYEFAQLAGSLGIFNNSP